MRQAPALPRRGVARLAVDELALADERVRRVVRPRARRRRGDERDEDDEDDEEDPVPEAVRVGLGRGAVMATVLAVRALPEWEDDLPADLAEGWRTLLAYTTTAIDAPADAEGRRPKRAYQELRRLAAKIDRLVARQITDHGGLMAFVAAAVAQEIADGTFVPGDFTLPSRAELEGPVPLPGSRASAPEPDADPEDELGTGGERDLRPE